MKICKDNNPPDVVNVEDIKFGIVFVKNQKYYMMCDSHHNEKGYCHAIDLENGKPVSFYYGFQVKVLPDACLNTGK